MEVHAFGLFLGDLVERLGPEGSPEVLQVRPLLQQLVERCVAGAAASRPLFKEVVEVLQGFASAAAAAAAAS
jgi:hypothetical protein